MSASLRFEPERFGSASMNVKAVVVSLKTATQRREQFAARVPQGVMRWSFFDAHRTLVPPLVYDEERARICKGRPLKPGELGCYSSHYAIWRQLLSDDCDGYFVLEDDVVADWRFLQALAAANLTAHGISYLRLYYKRSSRFIVRKRNFIRRSTSIIELLDLSFGTQGYFISRPTAAHFVKSLGTVVRPVDDQLDRHWDHGVPNLSIFPFPLIEAMGPSDIGQERFSCEAFEDSLRHRVYQMRDRITKHTAILRRRAASWLAT